MEMKCFDKGIFGSNCYVVWDETEGVIIDAGVPEDKIVAFINENNIKIKYIILTHGHIDHICFTDILKEKTGAKVLIHTEDNKMLAKPQLNGSMLLGQSTIVSQADETVKDQDIIQVGNLNFEVLHTPGHSQGSICIKVEDKLFSGDTLFCLGCGRTDLYGGNQSEMDKSFKEKLLKLDNNTKVYPGHGDSTTIEFEKQNNSYIRSL
ncbi:MAG: MBL fold metallo-hydrolase [Clostridiaceae bacterium]|nr:MBL fold metallo-hydrolase [Clostridiaceae bacterium]